MWKSATISWQQKQTKIPWAVVAHACPISIIHTIQGVSSRDERRMFREVVRGRGIQLGSRWNDNSVNAETVRSSTANGLIVGSGVSPNEDQADGNRPRTPGATRRRGTRQSLLFNGTGAETWWDYRQGGRYTGESRRTNGLQERQGPSRCRGTRRMSTNYLAGKEST